MAEPETTHGRRDEGRRDRQRKRNPAGGLARAEKSEKEATAMAEREASSGRLLTDFADSILGAMRDIAARSIDANVSFAKQMLDFQAQTTSWAKDTPMSPMFQSQYALGEGLIELFAGAARALWRIEKAKPES
jgi:hypothetical protein